jgi:cysteine desulfurase
MRCAALQCTNMDWIYLDNNATTQPTPEVIAAMTEANQLLWANPSSVHRFGQLVRQRIDLARHSVAQLIGCRDRELVFTSGGTESNNLALRSYLSPAIPDPRFREGARRLLFTTKVEHAAIREPAELLEKQDIIVHYLPVDEAGWLDPKHLQDAIEQQVKPGDRAFVSIQWVNNETGVIQPIEQLSKMVEATRANWRASESNITRSTQLVFHVDATQAVGKLPINVSELEIDLMTFAAHKFHGPKGAGCLYAGRGTRLQPINLGGPQESERRGGTENTPGIIGMGVAAEQVRKFQSSSVDSNGTTGAEQIEQLRNHLESTIIDALPFHAVVNSKSRPRIWNTSNIGFRQLEAEAIMLGLSERGVCASAGAACSSGSLEASPVLLAMSIPETIAHGSVRFSLSRFTTKSEIEQAAAVLIEVVNKVGKTMPMG